jgi:hypothetical protein
MAIKHTTRRAVQTTSNPARSGSGSDERITFEPTRLLGGISFHLLDDELALEVDQRSVQSLRAQLEREGLIVTVSRHDWERMTDYDRLHWMLRAGGVNVSHHDGVAKLSART